MQSEWDYPPEDRSATSVRRAALKALAEAGIGGRLSDDVQLVTGELVTNAICHAATDFTVSVEIGSERVRVEVFDGDTRNPAMLASGPDATSGRGLVIVAALAAAWGSESAERDGITGKIVWAELERTPDPPTSISATSGGS
jgi:anti-sigma regulatory factor (Ser/Thr protein kinase)